MRKSTTRIALIVVIGVIVILGYYTYLSNKTKEEKQEAAMSQVQLTLSRDLEKDYPPTPKEVMKYYNEIMACFYNNDCTSEEIDALGNKTRELYDQELLANNDLGGYLIALHQEIETFKAAEKRFSKLSVAPSTSVERFTEDGYSFARIMCGYNIVEEDSTSSADQVYLLRQDADKKWKIYGWQPVSEVASEEQ